MLSLLFSPNGRLNRARFWQGALILLGLGLVLVVVCFALSRVIPGEPTTDGSYKVQGVKAIPYLVLIFGYFAVSFWCGICLGIKRFHDRGKPGVWILIQLVPFIGPVWYFVEAGCLPGTPGSNAYGPDSLGPASLSAVF